MDMSNDPVYQMLVRLSQDIGEVKGELVGVNLRLDKVNGRLSKHDDSIGDINGYLKRVGGMAFVIAGSLALLWNLLAEWIKSQLL